MDTTRHQRRILLVQAIFLWEHQLSRKPEIKSSASEQQAALEYIWETDLESSLPDALTDFDRERFFGVANHLDEIKNVIKIYAPEWPVDRIASQDRAILYLSVYELLHSDVPPAVVINEAVELAKEFGAERSSKFINGVLSSVNKSRHSPDQPTT